MMYVKMKKALCVFFALTVLFLPSCSGKFSKESDIHTFSYSDGSGLRLSFISSGDFIYINDEGESTNSFTKYTSVEKPADMISAVSSDPAAIGYTLSCYKDESVKEVKIDGTSPTYENVKNDVYPLYCPLYLLYDDTLITDGGLDFIRYILSSDAQQIITKNNFVSISDGTYFITSKPKGNLTLYCSYSSYFIVDKLAKAYMNLVNTGLNIEIQTSLSGTCAESAKNGGIAFTSAEIPETALTCKLYSACGISVIVHPSNPNDSLTSENIKEIFSGTKSKWKEI